MFLYPMRFLFTLNMKVLKLIIEVYWKILKQDFYMKLLFLMTNNISIIYD